VSNLAARLDRSIDVPHAARLAVWVGVSVVAAALAVRYARRAGAPAIVWVGVALYPLLSAATQALVYAGMWDAFGALIAEGDAGNWPLPGEFVKGTATSLVASVPMVFTAWLTARRTRGSDTPHAEQALQPDAPDVGA
jgi:hypothetical protein